MNDAEREAQIRQTLARDPYAFKGIHEEFLLRLLDEARAEITDLQRTFDLMWAADQRAIKAWQEANPGNEMVWPDRAKLTRWLLNEIARLTAQLPDEMKHCTILFKECEKGHGRLTATNWIDHGCMKCEIDRLTADKANLCDEAEERPATIARLTQENEQLRAIDARIIDEREVEMQKAPPDGPTDEDISALVKPIWLKVKPNLKAQAIRSSLSVEFDDIRWEKWLADFIPDYVWDLVDIAAQRGMDRLTADAERTLYGMLSSPE